MSSKFVFVSARLRFVLRNLRQFAQSFASASDLLIWRKRYPSIWKFAKFANLHLTDERGKQISWPNFLNQLRKLKYSREQCLQAILVYEISQFTKCYILRFVPNHVMTTLRKGAAKKKRRALMRRRVAKRRRRNEMPPLRRPAWRCRRQDSACMWAASAIHRIYPASRIS